MNGSVNSGDNERIPMASLNAGSHSAKIAYASLTIPRRDVLKVGAAALAGSLSTAAFARPRASRTKKIIIAGAGITGLSCGYELMKRGHEVVVIEASGRAGGHVRTLREGLDDGLYADLGRAVHQSGVRPLLGLREGIRPSISLLSPPDGAAPVHRREVSY